MHQVIFTPAARMEMIDAQEWYEREAQGLGRSFRAAVEAVVERMSANPYLFPVTYKHARRGLVRRFPYALMFVVEADETVTVVACLHGSRDPLRWQRRM